MTCHPARRNALLRSLAASILAVTSACALKPPVRNSGPSISREGVQLAVVKQRCQQLSDPDQTEDLAELIVEVQVHNPTSVAATVRRGEFRLIGDDRFALKTSTGGASEPLTVAPGSDQSFELRFMARGAFECAKELRLDPGGGVISRDHPVDLPPVRFVAWRA
jgi:hypothetical protein